MKKIGSIHTFEDRAFLSGMVRASVAVFAIGAGLGVLWFTGLLPVLFGLGQHVGTDSLVDANTMMGFVARANIAGVPVGAMVFCSWLLLLVVVTMVALAVHEVVHALFFKLFAPAGTRVRFGVNWKAGMIYACAEGIVYTRHQYLVIALAPTVAVTALLLVAGAFTGLPMLGYVAAVVHLSGCTGDWGYIGAIHRDSQITHCEDTTWGVQFYCEGKDEVEVGL